MLSNSMRMLARSSKLSMQSRRAMTYYYTKEHEYVKVEKDGSGIVGVTDFAQTALGDVVYVELPEVGDEFKKGDAFGSVESVKAASDVYLPVNGKVIERNEKLIENPGLVNESALDKGWFIKIKLSSASDVNQLMTADAYKAHCQASEKDH